MVAVTPIRSAMWLLAFLDPPPHRGFLVSLQSQPCWVVTRVVSQSAPSATPSGAPAGYPHTSSPLGQIQSGLGHWLRLRANCPLSRALDPSVTHTQTQPCCQPSLLRNSPRDLLPRAAASPLTVCLCPRPFPA